MGYIIRILEPIRVDVPARVRDWCVLRTKRMLTNKTFFTLMRSEGFPYTRALWIQGAIERESYVIVETKRDISGVTEVKEHPPEIARNKLFTTKYEFSWYARIEYDIPGHELHVEFNVNGIVEVHDFMMFSIDTIMDMLDSFLTSATGMFISDFFTPYEFPMDTGFSDFHEYKEDIKDLDEPLDRDIRYVTVHMRRHTYQPWSYRPNLTSAYEEYAYEALVRFNEWVVDTTNEFLRKEMEGLAEEVEEALREAVISRYKAMVEYAKDISGLKKVEAMLEKEKAEQKITDEEYETIKALMREKSKELFKEIIERWIKRLEGCKTEMCVDNRMKEIMQSEIWNNPLFEEYRDVIFQKEREIRNRIYSEELKVRKVPIEAIHKRVRTFFDNRIKELSRVKELDDLIRRIERSVLPDEVKKELVSKAEAKKESISKERCDTARKIIAGTDSIAELIRQRALIRANRHDYYLCYEELMRMINERMKELRKSEEERTVAEIVERYEETEESERLRYLESIIGDIQGLKRESRKELYTELVRRARSKSEILALAGIFSRLGVSKRTISEEAGKKGIEIEEIRKVIEGIKLRKPDVVEKVEKIRKEPEEVKVEEVETLCDEILGLAEEEQYAVFIKLIDEARTVAELRKIEECIRKSQYIDSDKILDALTALLGKLRRLRRR